LIKNFAGLAFGVALYIGLNNWYCVLVCLSIGARRSALACACFLPCPSRCLAGVPGCFLSASPRVFRPVCRCPSGCPPPVLFRVAWFAPSAVGFSCCFYRSWRLQYKVATRLLNFNLRVGAPTAMADCEPLLSAGFGTGSLAINNQSIKGEKTNIQ